MREMKSTREAFGEAIVELGRRNKKVVVVSGDLEDSTRAVYFKQEFPDRFFNLGIAEQDILGTCVGLSLSGFIPFACSFAVFITHRPYEILKISICYNNSNVKLIGSHAGLTVGEDGATAQCLEDFASLRVLPNMTIFSPVDAIETKKAVFKMAQIEGPVYTRLGRYNYPVITTESDPFETGKANIIRKGGDVAVIATGLMVSEALKAAEYLSTERIEAGVINMHTIKPLDVELITGLAKETGAIVTAEEHQAYGGLGSAVAQVLTQNYPVPQEIVAVQDTFAESADAQALLTKYHLKDADIVNAVKKVLKRK